MHVRNEDFEQQLMCNTVAVVNWVVLP